METAEKYELSVIFRVFWLRFLFWFDDWFLWNRSDLVMSNSPELPQFLSNAKYCTIELSELFLKEAVPFC